MPRQNNQTNLNDMTNSAVAAKFYNPGSFDYFNQYLPDTLGTLNKPGNNISFSKKHPIRNFLGDVFAGLAAMANSEHGAIPNAANAVIGRKNARDLYNDVGNMAIIEDLKRRQDRDFWLNQAQNLGVLDPQAQNVQPPVNLNSQDIKILSEITGNKNNAYLEHSQMTDQTLKPMDPNLYYGAGPKTSDQSVAGRIQDIIDSNNYPQQFEHGYQDFDGKVKPLMPPDQTTPLGQLTKPQLDYNLQPTEITGWTPKYNKDAFEYGGNIASDNYFNQKRLDIQRMNAEIKRIFKKLKRKKNK